MPHRIIRFASVVILASAAIALPAMAADTAAGKADGISVSVNVVRTDAAKGLYQCTAEVIDLRSGEVIAAPKIAFTATSGATTRSGSQPDPKKPASEVVIEVSASQAGDGATYKVTYTREGVLAAVQKGSLSLR